MYMLYCGMMREINSRESLGSPGPIDIFSCFPAGLNTARFPDPDWKLRRRVKPPPREPGIRLVQPSFFTAICILAEKRVILQKINQKFTHWQYLSSIYQMAQYDFQKAVKIIRKKPVYKNKFSHQNAECLQIKTKLKTKLKNKQSHLRCIEINSQLSVQRSFIFRGEERNEFCFEN